MASGTARTIKASQIQSDRKLTYPLNVEYTGHFMVYLPKKYEYTGGKVGFIQIQDTHRAMVLPLPRNLSEAYGADWNAESIGATASGVASAIANYEGGLGGLPALIANIGTESAISAGMQNVESGSAALAAAAATAALGGGAIASAASAAIGATAADIARGVKAGFGVAANPYLALLFQGVNLRHHSFTYEFFAKNPKESEEVKRIIDRFRYCMLPSYNVAVPGSGRAIFNYPNIFHIGFMQNEYLFSFKPCALLGMNVNYHQQGDAFYFDVNGTKIPASVQVTLEFKELEIIIKDDFENENMIKSGSTLFTNEII